MGALLEITQVSLEGSSELRGAFVEVPKAGLTVEARGLDISGWVIGAASPVVAVELRLAGHRIARLPVDVDRPDLATAFPDEPEARHAGFSGTVALVGTASEPQLELHAVLADDRRVRMAVISGSRRWRQSPAAAERDLVSVVVPCHRQAHYLPEALESLRLQTYPHVEVVVVDDGSPDNAGEVARRRAGVRVVSQERRGLSEARNTGLRHTNGDLVVFLDADDQLLPRALETGVEHLRAHPEAAFVSGHYRHVAADGSDLPTPRQLDVHGDHFAALLRHNIAGMPGTVMFRRAVFEHVRGFDASIPACEDYELYLRVARQFPVSSHNEVIGLYRRHAAGMSGDPEVMLPSALTALRRQRSFVKGHHHLETAYREGLAFWTQYYGEPLRERVGSGLEERDWPGVARDARTFVGETVRARLAAPGARRTR